MHVTDDRGQADGVIDKLFQVDEAFSAQFMKRDALEKLRHQGEAVLVVFQRHRTGDAAYVEMGQNIVLVFDPDHVYMQRIGGVGHFDGHVFPVALAGSPVDQSPVVFKQFVLEVESCDIVCHGGSFLFADYDVSAFSFGFVQRIVDTLVQGFMVVFVGEFRDAEAAGHGPDTVETGGFNLLP